MNGALRLWTENRGAPKTQIQRRPIQRPILSPLKALSMWITKRQLPGLAALLVGGAELCTATTLWALTCHHAGAEKGVTMKGVFRWRHL